jgi:hypothetical protein
MQAGSQLPILHPFTHFAQEMGVLSKKAANIRKRNGLAGLPGRKAGSGELCHGEWRLQARR